MTSRGERVSSHRAHVCCVAQTPSTRSMRSCNKKNFITPKLLNSSQVNCFKNTKKKKWMHCVDVKFWSKGQRKMCIRSLTLNQTNHLRSTVELKAHTCMWGVKLKPDRAMAQAVSRRPPTAEARVQSRVDPSGTRGLRRGSAAARLLELWVRISSGSWMFVLCLLYKV